MSLFGMFNYAKEGPGVSKDGPQKKRFFVFFEIYFRKFGNLIKMNVLYLLFCLPIVTIGPANAGLTHVLRSFTKEEHAFLWADFWRVFRENFKQGFVVGLIEILLKVGLLFVVWFYYIEAAANSLFYIPMVLCIILLITVNFMGYYVYLLMVTMNLSIKALIKNSFILSVLGTKNNWLTLIFTLIILAALLLTEPLLYIIIIFWGPSTIKFIETYNAYPAVKKYCIDPVLAQQEGDVEEQESIFSDERLIADDGSDEYA